ncbi:MAG: Asp-tRNA(Asn)/Glu-tRNA(Gln) amidotransferase subunit GatA [Candidatus Dadabacteria bacterium]|nr:MAG: Asp-tRNA(Asn)/Glu-tRNA(Gln) amidotransferase subunit GatA [Candidatus Dadabacteria bacterium]
MNELLSLSISEIVRGLRQRRFSATEIASAYLEQCEKLKHLNAYIKVCSDAILKEAENMDKLTPGSGDLIGVPLAIKDILVTRGIATTCGSKMLENFIPPYDATVWKRLKDAGALLLGKTNMDEFAMGSSNENSFFGPVLNPWDNNCVSGGSSGGSACAVAARMAPAALGSDTGGSVRQPASFCGIVGFKPTYGRISRYGLIAFASSLDQVGIFTRNIDDCICLYKLIAGYDPYDSTSVDKPVGSVNIIPDARLDGLRIGIPAEYFTPALNNEIKEVVNQALEALSAQGAELVEISLPHTEYAVATYYIISPAEASSNLSRYDGVRYGHRAGSIKSLEELYKKSRSEGFGPEVKRRILIGNYVLSAGYYDAYYRKAQKVRRLIAEDFANAFENKCDIIATPTTPSVAFKIGEKTSDPLQMYLNDIFTVPASLAGLPAISIPCGFSGDNMPVGLQLIANAWDEERLLQTAAVYQRVTEWHRRVPNGL